MKNWKTSLAAVCVVLPQILRYLFPKTFTEGMANAMSLLFAALGLGVAKDHNVTGGTTANVPNDAAAVDATAKQSS